MQAAGDRTRQLQEAQQHLEKHSKSNVDLQHKLEQAQHLLQQEQDKVEKHRRQLDVQDKHFEDALESQAYLEKGNNTLEEEISERKQQHQDSEQQPSIFMEAPLLPPWLEAAKQELYARDYTVDKLREHLQKAEHQSGENYNSKVELKSQLDDMTLRLVAEHDTVTNLQHQLQQAEQQSDAVHSSKARLEAQLDVMTQQLAAQHSTVAQLQEQLSQAELQLAEDHNSRAEMSTAALQAEGNIRQAVERALVAEEERDNLAAKLVRRSKEHAALEKRLEHELGEKTVSLSD